jgi:hypothetical protein
MAGIARFPGESEADWRRRVIKAEHPNLDPDPVVGPATDGPRLVGETEAARKERLANHDRYNAPRSAKTDDESDAEDC